MGYRDYTVCIRYGEEDECYVGKIVDIRDMIVFDGNTIDEIRQNFHDMVDHYIATCAETGRKPDKPVSEIMVPGFPRDARQSLPQG